MKIKILPLEGKFEKDGKFVEGKLCIGEIDSEYLDENFTDAALFVPIDNSFVNINNGVATVYWVVVDCEDSDKIMEIMGEFINKGLDLCINPVILEKVRENIPENFVNVVFGNVSDPFTTSGFFSMGKLLDDLEDYEEMI